MGRWGCRTAGSGAAGKAGVLPCRCLSEPAAHLRFPPNPAPYPPTYPPYPPTLPTRTRRSDGTRAFYFSEERLRALFEAEGLRCLAMTVHERDIQNRAKGVKMDRRWVQATFELPIDTAATTSAGGGGGGNATAGVEASEKWETEADGVRSVGGDLTWCFLEPEGLRLKEVTVSLGGGQARLRPSGAPPPPCHAQLLFSVSAVVSPLLPLALSSRVGYPRTFFIHLRAALTYPYPYPYPSIRAQTASVSVVGREHQHTERATGLMLWEGASALAAHVQRIAAAASSAAATDDKGDVGFSGRSVLELGAGSSGLPSMARGAREATYPPCRASRRLIPRSFLRAAPPAKHGRRPLYQAFERLKPWLTHPYPLPPLPDTAPYHAGGVHRGGQSGGGHRRTPGRAVRPRREPVPK